MPSAEKHAEIIDKYITKELEAGRIAGLFEEHELTPLVQIRNETATRKILPHC